MNTESTGPNDPLPSHGGNTTNLGSAQTAVAAPGFSTRRVFLLAMPLGMLVLGGLGGKFWADSTAERRSSFEALERQIGIGEPIQNRLADRYADANSDLVADCPSDPKLLLDPDILKFSYIPSQDADAQAKIWKPWCDYLAKATGKRVEYLPIATVDEQMKALKAGKLHVAGLNTGTVPLAVDQCGFVPLCTLGRDDNSFGYSMLLIVPAKSPIHDPKDLRGKRIAMKDAMSNSGFKAPIVTLLNEFGLRPTRDYEWYFTYEYENAIRLVAQDKCVAAAVASDRLAALIHEGEIKEADIHVIYKSATFPPAAMGCVYNLKPELAAKIKTALLECKWTELGLTERLGGGGATRFVPVSYREAFAPVRQIDDTMGVRHQVN